MSDPWRNLNVHQFPGGEFHTLDAWWNNYAIRDEHHLLQALSDSDSVNGGYESPRHNKINLNATRPVPKMNPDEVLNGKWRN